ncbi:glycosyltransferase [Dasania marina]|uniref:glycosyltransferase n=1 Tax=Dasania marina TaxID=471499 RepID=UPI0030D8B28C|tara:strand:+ start:34898 stop:35959 length:1062 start_codon:yes stop_codon:yes gene_type:complete
MKNIAFVIPAFNPGESLLCILDELIRSSCECIYVVDDGSSAMSKPIFDTIVCNKKYADVTLLKHAVNLGKGAALKTAFNYILASHPDIDGAVTLDSDGQHSANDCIKIQSCLYENPDSFVLGYRKFRKDIPLKSYFGNNISRLLYNFFLGRKYKDTQTGLRGIPRKLMIKCLSIKSNRFEFETEQLIIASSKEDGVPTIEVPIETIYIDDNKASSFRPVVDSFRIYFVLFRYSMASVLTSLVDLLCFYMAIEVGFGVLVSNLISRSIALGVQFSLLNTFVFRSKFNALKLASFIVYVYVMGAASAWLQITMSDRLVTSELMSKLVVEVILFFFNFAFLKSYIFTRGRNSVETN